jgi:hypothetical protein
MERKVSRGERIGGGEERTRRDDARGRGKRTRIMGVMGEDKGSVEGGKDRTRESRARQVGPEAHQRADGAGSRTFEIKCSVRWRVTSRIETTESKSKSKSKSRQHQQ